MKKRIDPSLHCCVEIMASSSNRRASSWLPGGGNSSNHHPWPSAADVLLRSWTRLNLPAIVPSPASWTTLFPRQWPPTVLSHININLLYPSAARGRRSSHSPRSGRRDRSGSPALSLTSYDSCFTTTPDHEDDAPPQPSYGRNGYYEEDQFSSASSYSSYSKFT